MEGQPPLLAALTGAHFVQEHATFDLSDEFAQAVFAVDPTDPLFRSIDSNDGVGADFSVLRDHALIRIPVILPPNVTVDELGTDPDITMLPDGRIQVIVRRSSPHVLNVALKEPGTAPLGYHRGGGIMWDGRELELAHQAGSALNDHFQPTIPFTAQQRTDIANFQRSLFSSPELAEMARGGAEPGPPECPPHATAACLRGREFLIEQPMLSTDMAHRGFCASCHGGPMMMRTSPFNPLQPPYPPLPSGGCPCSNGQPPGPSGTCAPYVDMEGPIDYPGVGLVCLHRTSAMGGLQPTAELPFRTYRFATPAGEFVIHAHDPGRPLRTGDPCGEVPASCGLSPGVALPQFMIATLRGVSHRQRFLHDNVEATVHDQVDAVAVGSEQVALALRAFGDPNWEAFILSPGDVDDITAYILESHL